MVSASRYLAIFSRVGRDSRDGGGMDRNSSPMSPQPSPRTPPKFGPRTPPESRKEGNFEPAPLLEYPPNSQSLDTGRSRVQTPEDGQIPP